MHASRKIAAALLSPLLFILPTSVLVWWQRSHPSSLPHAGGDVERQLSADALAIVALVAYLVLALFAYASSHTGGRLTRLSPSRLALRTSCAGIALGLLVWPLALSEGGLGEGGAMAFSVAFSLLFLASALPAIVCWRLLLK
jgi:hypothetical protein